MIKYDPYTTSVFRNDHTSIKDHTLGQNVWVSHVFDRDLDFSRITGELTHFDTEESTAWKQFKERAAELKKNTSKIRVACAPIFGTTTTAEGRVMMQYEVRGDDKIPVATDFAAMIFSEECKESYLIPNKRDSSVCAIKNLLTTAEKVQRLSGVMFGGETMDPSETAQPALGYPLEKKYIHLEYNFRTKQAVFTTQKIALSNINGKVKRKGFVKENSQNIPHWFVVLDSEYPTKKDPFTPIHRGHFSAAEENTHSPTAMKESCTLSNATPMCKYFNKSTWRRLEIHSHSLLKEAAKKHGDKTHITVVNGPLFRPEEGTNLVTRPVIGGEKRVPRPSHCFKVIQTPDATHSYLIKNVNDKFKGETAQFAKDHEVSLEELSKLSGLNIAAILSGSNLRGSTPCESSLSPAKAAAVVTTPKRALSVAADKENADPNLCLKKPRLAKRRKRRALHFNPASRIGS